MKHLNQIFLLGCLLLSSATYAQVKVGDNPTNIDPSASFEVESTSKGLLIPRMTEAQRTAIATPANGLLVYQTDATPGFYYYDGTTWQFLNSKGWSTSGNEAGAGDFIGTTNNESFKINARGKKIAEFGTTSDSITLKFFTDTIKNSNYQRYHLSNYVNVNNNGTFNRQVRGFNNYIFYDNTTLTSGAVSIAGLNEINYRAGSTGFTNWTNGTFSAVRTNQGSNVVVQQANAMNAEITNSLTSTSIIRNARGINVESINATGSDSEIHTAVGVRISSNINATGGTKNLVYPIFSESTESSYLAGGLGIGVSENNNFKPHNSAALEVNSTTQGFLPPRMSLNQMSLINSPAEGLVVYCTDCLPLKGLRVFDGTTFVDMNGVADPYAQFTFTGNYRNAPNFYAGKTMNNENNLEVEINVTTAGKITFTSNTTNGYSFNAQSHSVTTGTKYVTLFASGTQTAYNVAGDSFTISGQGTTLENTTVIVSHVQVGAALTSFSNGSENFSDNATCVSKPISANHTAASCSGAVTLGSNSYNVVLINGQCWMQSNLKEVPTAPCSDAPNTGCNIWNNTSLTDLGSWGYYNTVTTNGAAGWATTEPAANEGLLYQWSAAMNGSTTERAQGVCPTGWHIPSDCEWMYLEHGQGMAIAQQTTNNTWRNTTGEGNKLRGVGGSWNNSSGFTALLAGDRFTNGTFNSRGSLGNWWSSSETGTASAQGRRLASSGAGVYRGSFNRALGFSVRCLKD